VFARPLPHLTVLLVVACTRTNPAFDAAGGSGDPTTGTKGTTGTTGAASTGPQEVSTGAAPTSEDTTTGGTTIGADPTDGITTTTTTMPDLPDDSSTGAPADCWGLAPGVWDSVEELPDAQLGDAPSSPRITPGGLGLVYMAGTPSGKRPHRSNRASLDEPFVVGKLLAAWPGLNFGLDHPSLLRGDAELILAGRPGFDDQLFVATWNGSLWSAPVPMTPPIATLLHESIATFTEDGGRMIFQREDGPPNPDLNSASWRFHEASRAPDGPPGAPFDAPSAVVLPGISDDPNYNHINVCPTLSPDGLHLFFGSTFPIVLTPNNQPDALNVFYTARAGLGQPWAPPQEITQLREATWETCPSSVTRDGCTLVFHRFKFQMNPGDYRIYLARRSPG
jgi:hypothetical protein